ncbi:DUF3561 family protein [Salmonella enterica subsp. enterica serovar Kentucky]|nr:DUF3561 family protein [Salmonella enterica subsp. enterica serovar Kentucky]
MTPPVHFRGGGRLCVMAAGVGIPFLLYGPNTLFFLYTALFPRVNAGIGDYRHCVASAGKGQNTFSIMFTLLAVGALFGALFIWLLG